ncbi:hypothetical protein E2562_015582 [Oryza meyeriana var. granulata]|uniref:Uncharacterized protein n=1 Tax=Oryza meyeriana var. granulata TaxID=110450 RepID=A0A6G1ELZ4_9ORYZ|nr:hypothetical protein E2562_015582 [Oryza meyeriana var. granulata]
MDTSATTWALEDRRSRGSTDMAVDTMAALTWAHQRSVMALNPMVASYGRYGTVGEGTDEKRTTR